MIGLGKLLPFALNQTRRLQLSQYILGSGHALAEHFGYLLNREDDINSPRLVRPPVELGQPRPVKQKGIGQLGGKGQAHVHQEPGKEEIGRQFGGYLHVVGHGISLLGVGLSDRRCGPLEARFRGREGNVSGPL